LTFFLFCIIVIVIMIRKIPTNRNLRQKVFESLKNFIISDQVLPGVKIEEDTLARNLGVSKTPIREALSKLAHEGIVKIVPNRGSYKVKITKEDLMEIMLIREALEGLCIRLAAANMNNEVIEKLKALLDDFETNYLEKDIYRYTETNLKFYDLIYKTAKSPWLIRIIQSTRDLTQLLRLMLLKDPERVRYSLKAHRDLIEAFEKRDVRLAERIRRDMLRTGYESYIRMLEEREIHLSKMERKGIFKREK